MFAILLVACGGKKEEAPKPTVGSASAVAVVADAAAIDGAVAPARVELLHSYLAFVEVSSHVRNKTIKPEHLVDGDLQTAWNSVTGELVGAWLEINASGMQIDEVRLTVGHTGKGPKGEDYWVMNPRIEKVAVLDGPKVVATVALDPDNRGLQSVKLPAPLSKVRLRVEEVVMGTKKTWREVCVSELEAWGMPPAGAKPSKRVPVVSVFEPPPPDPGELARGKPVDTVKLCDEIMKPLQAEWDGKSHGMEDAPPRCDVAHTSVEARDRADSPWLGVSVFRVAYNEVHGPMSCTLVVSTDAGDFFVGESRGCGPWDNESIEPRSAAVRAIMPGAGPWLVVEYATTRGDLPVEMIVCQVQGDAVVCTKPWQIENATFKVAPRFSKGMVVFDPVEGSPPASLGGAHAIVFDG